MRWQNALALALFGVGGVAYRGGQPAAVEHPATPDAAKTATEKKLPPPSVAPAEKSPAVVLRGFLQQYGKLVSAEAQPSDLKDTVDFLWATVPDPEDPPLALQFDRSIESIQRALENAGYAFDRSWYPWSGPPDAATAKEREEQAAAHESRRKQPGMLLFRRQEIGQKRPLAVLLIAESPLSGIVRDEFDGALGLDEQFGPSSPGVLLLGPTYSGSFPSLRAAIQSANQCANRTFRVISGTATHGELETAFNKTNHVQYSCTVHSDSAALNLFHGYLAKELGLQGETIGLLSEDATVYGDQFQGDHILHLRFSRNISQVRNAYPSDFGVRRSPESTSGSGGASLPFEWKDERSVPDGATASASRHTPSSKEAVLLDLAGTLVREKTKFAGIVATDALDELFLAQFLREHAPDTRLFILDADLLFVGAARNLSLRGVLVVTTYPLFNYNQYWTSGQDYPKYQRRMLFASRYAEGVYNACRALLYSRFPKVEAEPLVFDYAYPDDPFRPPLWLSVIGRDAIYPVAHLDQKVCTQNNKGGCVDSLLFTSPIPRKAELKPNPVSRMWTSVFYALSAAGLCLAFLVAVDLPPGKRWASEGGRWSGMCSVRPDEPGAADRVFYLQALGLSFTALFILFACPLWGAKIPHPPLLALPISCLVPAVLLAALAAVIVRVWQMQRRQTGVRRYYYALSGLAWAGFAAFLVYVVWMATSTGGQNQHFFFLYRALQLTSGVSPTLPLIVIAAAFCYCGWVHFQRLVFVQERRPRLPALRVSSGGSGDSALDRPAEAFLLGISELLPIVLLAVVVCATIKPWEHQITFESKPYDFLLLSAALLLYGVIYFTWVRFLKLWVAVRGLLQSLERHPLRRAFSRLPAEYSLSPLWLTDAAKRTFTIMTRETECLRLIVHEDSQAYAALHDSLSELETAADALVAAAGRRSEAAAFHQVQRTLSDAGAILIEDLSHGPWLSGCSDSYAEMRKRKAPEETTEDEKRELRKLRPVLLKEEFLALRFVAFFRYAFLQMQNLLLFVVLGFILALVSLDSYPIQGGQPIAFSAGLFFLILGGGVVVVFMQIDRDAILSRINNTAPGRLDWDFAVRLLTYGAGPVAAVLATQFPSVGRLVSNLLNPVLEALR